MTAPEKDELIEKRLDELCKDFGKWVNVAGQDGMPDSLARHFHIRTINRLKDVGLDGIFKDALFFDYLYATLVTWGLNRGKKKNRLFGFQDFVNGICSHHEKITILGSQSLATMKSKTAAATIDVARGLGRLVRDLSMSLSIRERTLVLGTKTLHHLLPDLVPPIDNTYTLKFLPYGGESEGEFIKVFLDYLYIYRNEYDLIEELISSNPLNSSITKTIDNAIIGYQKSKGNPIDSELDSEE